MLRFPSEYYTNREKKREQRRKKRQESKGRARGERKRVRGVGGRKEEGV